MFLCKKNSFSSKGKVHNFVNMWTFEDDDLHHSRSFYETEARPVWEGRGKREGEKVAEDDLDLG